MEKPITIKIQELKENLAKLINESGLPSYIIEPIIKDFYQEIYKLNQAQFLKDKEEYEKKGE